MEEELGEGDVFEVLPPIVSVSRLEFEELLELSVVGLDFLQRSLFDFLIFSHYNS